MRTTVGDVAAPAPGGRGAGGRSARRRWVAGVLALGLAASGCGGSDGAGGAGADTDETSSTTAAVATPADESGGAVPAAVAVPGDEWDTAEPGDLGLDGAPLADLATYLQENQSNCMVVVKGGRVVASEYWDMEPSDDREIWSASKSVTSTLVGIAQDEGLLSLDDLASDYIPEWKGTPSESVTIRNLVSNDSGRFYSFESDYTSMAVVAPDKTAYAIGLDQQHDPGTHWDYNNSAIQTLEQVIETATGQDMAEYAQEKLFGPLGMSASITRDKAGNPLAFMGVQAGCDDMARFGELFLREGAWGDEQVVSSEWVAEATAPSQELNERYGFLWWRGFDGLPDDAFAALGLGNQIVLVMPSQDMVVVRLGGAPTGGAGVANQGAMVSEMAAAALAASGD